MYDQTWNPARKRDTGVIYRYPAAYRIQALIGALLAGAILFGSVIAEIEAASPADAILHGASLVIGLVILTLGLDFGTRSIVITPEGLQVRWVRKTFIAWQDISGWNYLPLSLTHIHTRHGPGLFIWPIFEHYTDILAAIDRHRNDGMMERMSNGKTR